jgi:hypothetical protein
MIKILGETKMTTRAKGRLQIAVSVILLGVDSWLIYLAHHSPVLVTILLNTAYGLLAVLILDGIFQVRDKSGTL